ncbi:MAG: ABC transporter permease [Mycoplasma sp.]
MWNLIKNAFRSLKRNKLNMVGLTFLVFISTTVFTTLNSTTTSINTEYQQVSEQGNIHDATISQVYDIGIAKYANNIEEQHGTEAFKSYLYNQNKLVKSNDNSIVPFVSASKNDNNYTFSLYYLLDIDQIANHTAIKEFFLNVKDNVEEWNNFDRFLAPSVTVTLQDNSNHDQQKLYNYAKTEQKAYGKDHADQITNKTSQEINDLIKDGFTDQGATNEKLKNASDELYQYAATKDTPLDLFLKTNYHDQVSFRDFNSLEISNSADNIFYKAVASDPEDNIDKLVNLKINNNPNGINWSNFSVKDATYGILSYQENDNYTLGRTLSYLPSSLSQYDVHYFEKVQLLKKSLWPQTDNNPIYEKLKVLPNLFSTDKNQRVEYWNKNLDNLKALLSVELSSHEEVFVKENRVTATWIVGNVPVASEIDNWTSLFANVNPEYLEANNKKTVNENDLRAIKKFASYIKNHPGIHDLRMLFIDWMNSLDYFAIDKIIKEFVHDHNEQVISPGGETPYLVIGSGITPDFIYPIVDISRTTPNPKNECIYFANQAGYYRIYDSFRGNKTEDYVVAKFKNSLDKASRQKIIDKINEFAASEMILPHGIKAAYFADDISNTLNASAFRVTFIPKFIQDINYVSYTLTVFVIILGLVICAIVINRYITINQSVLGIMQANGLSKLSIALSLLPFALIPSLVGAVGGVILGYGLQYFVLGLLSNYWMLPTNILAINIWSIVFAFGICLSIFMGVIIATSYWVLNQKTVDIMKTDSQDNPNIIAKSMKSLAAKFGIITRFRISVAFSSIWKLLVLAVMSSMVMSSLVFAISVNGKFDASINATNNSRNYSFAIKLATPTKAGGQYIPTRFDYNQEQLANGDLFKGYGVSGFNTAGNDNRDNVYLQPLYWGDGNKTIKFDLTSVVPWWEPIKSITLTYDGLDQPQLNGLVDGKDLNDLIEHEYYYSSEAIDLANHLSELFHPQEHVNKFRDAMMISNADQTKSQMMGNLFMPFMGDATGQLYDLFYLKNRTMTNATLDYVVGAFGQFSNPWDISASLMPENIRASALNFSQQFLNYVGTALHENEFKDPNQKILHDRIVNGFNTSNFPRFSNSDLDNLKQELVKNPNTGNYEIVKSKAVGSSAGVILNFELIHLLAIAYSFGPAANLDFPITYNTIPIKDSDETYTYLDANELSTNNPVTINGIKASENHYSQYISLTDESGNNLIQNLAYSQQDLANNVPFPIVINAYAAHKYGLGIGDTISFKINNRADNVEHQIKVDNKIPDPEFNNIARFVIKGINTSYENEEYFINQDVANYLLQLKSHLTDGEDISSRIQPNSWYANEEKTMGVDSNIGYPKDLVGFNTEDGLIDISKYQAKDPDQYQLTPYGFNGVFTKDPNGGVLLSKSMVLYSPSGLYLANDKINSDESFRTLNFGVNTFMAAKLTGILASNSELAKNIQQAYNTLIANKNEANQKALAKYSNELAQTIIKYYGSQVYEALVIGANDKTSSNLVYTNISNTVNQITQVIIIVIALMTIIIIALITSMVINDSKKLAAILKALGYTDHQNAATYLSIYIPVIIIGLLLAVGTSFVLLGIYNQIIFNGIGIWLNASIHWYYYLIVMSAVLVVFTVAGINGVLSLKRDRLIDAIK